MRRTVYLVGAILSLVIVGVVAASAQEDAETYSGCLTAGGIVNNVTIGEELTYPCSGNSTPISWNSQGPSGPIGPVGPQGPPGAPGGLSGWEIVESDYSDPHIEPGSGVNHGVACPAGKVVLGGGGQGAITADVAMVDSYPLGPAYGNQWRTTWRNIGDSPISIAITTFAICADGV